MEDLTILTSHGRVGIWGGPLDPSEPLVLLIGGAFVAERHVLAYARVMPCNFALTYLPGMYTPYFADHSIEAFAGAIDDALDQLGHKQVLVVGESLGGLVALGMKNPVIEGRLLLDTPLTTAGLWPIQQRLWERARLDPQEGKWIADLFGIFQDRLEERDYQYLLQSAPAQSTCLLRGEAPLGDPRQLSEVPSLVSTDDLAAYKRAGIEDRCVPGCGHHLAVQKAVEVTSMIGQMTERLWGRPLRKV